MAGKPLQVLSVCDGLTQRSCWLQLPMR